MIEVTSVQTSSPRSKVKDLVWCAVRKIAVSHDIRALTMIKITIIIPTVQEIRLIFTWTEPGSGHD